MADSFVFDKAFQQGIRRDSRTDRNAQFLIQCDNLKPTEWGLKPLPVVTYPIVSPALSMTWPHMQLERVDKGLMLLFTATAIYSVDLAFTASALTIYDATSDASTKSIPAGTGYWQVAGFQSSWFATKGNALVYRIPSTTSNRVVEVDTSLTVQAVANWNNRLVFGGMAGTHFSASVWTDLYAHWRKQSPQNIVIDDAGAMDTGHILIGPQSGGDNDIPFAAVMAALGLPSTTVFTDKWKEIVYGMIDRREIILYPLKHGGTVYAMKQYGAGLAVYAQNSVSVLSLDQSGEINEQVLLEHGGAGRGCVAGDREEHVFLTRQGDLYRTYLNQGHTRLDFDDLFGPMIANVVLTCDPVERDVYICNGVNGYILTATGLGRCSGMMPSSLLRMSGQDGLIGTHLSSADPTAATVETCLFDFGERFGVKEVAFANLATTDTIGWQASAKYRMDKSASLTSPTPIAVDDRGNARVKTSGIEFTLLLTAANRKLADLERVEVIKGQGKPSLRKHLDS